MITVVDVKHLISFLDNAHMLFSSVRLSRVNPKTPADNVLHTHFCFLIVPIKKISRIYPINTI